MSWRQGRTAHGFLLPGDRQGAAAGCLPGGGCDEAMSENECEIAHSLVSFASLVNRIVTDHGGPEQCLVVKKDGGSITTLTKRYV